MRDSKNFSNDRWHESDVTDRFRRKLLHRGIEEYPLVALGSSLPFGEHDWQKKACDLLLRIAFAASPALRTLSKSRTQVKREP